MARAEGSVWKSHRRSLVERGRGGDSICDGDFLVEDDDGRRPFVVRCDKCGQLLGVSQGAPAGDRDFAPDASEPF